jgi:cell division septation protein DedD
MTELLFSAYYKQFNANFSSYTNWVSGKSAYMNSMLALSYRLKKGLTVRSSAQFNISGLQVLSYKTEVEKRFLHNGYISVSYENYTATRSNSVNFNFKYDLSYAQTNASARISNNEVSTFQNVRGSLVFGKGKKQVLASELSNVGRGGISIIPFIDVNHNGKYDKHEPKASNLRVRINGGRIIYNEKDTVINVIGLEPFISYNLELDDKDFENLAWRIKEKTYKVLIDPNQLKEIYVPVIPVGEVSGTVNLKNDSDLTGIGRILVNFYNKDGLKVAQSLTESDGYFDYLGLEPGKYYARIDSVQLNRLNFTSLPAELPFEVENLESGDIVEGINFILNQNADQHKNDSILIKKNIVNAVPVPVVLKERLSDSIKNTVVKTEKTDDLKPVEPIIDTVNSRENPSNFEGHYYVQIGAFRSASKANNFESGLTGIIKYPLGIVVDDGYYKVRIGYFRTKNEAELCKEAMTKRDMVCFIGQSFYSGYLKNQVFRYGAYYVGIGTFRYKQSALEFAQKIKDRVTYVSGIVQEDGLFKVRVGYFETKTEAKSCADKLNGTGIKAIVGESKNFIYSGSLIPEI